MIETMTAAPATRPAPETDNTRNQSVSPPTTPETSSILPTQQHKQCTLQEFYNPQSWYNSSAFSHKTILHTNHLPTNTHDNNSNMAFRQPIPGYNALIADLYIELAATINLQCNLSIIADTIATADYEFARLRSQRKQAALEEHTPKRPKQLHDAILSSSDYLSIVHDFITQFKVTIGTSTLALIDISLQRHRAVERTINLQRAGTGVLDVDTLDPQTTVTNAALIAGTPDTPIVAKTEATTTSTIRRDLFNRPKALNWSPTPTTNRNKHIDDATVLVTLPVAFPSLDNATQLTLNCSYRDNPQTTLKTVLQILGINISTDFMEKVFTTDYTRTAVTINAIFKDHHATDQFQYHDYAATVSDRLLSPGINGLFTGKTGDNFSGVGALTTETPVLCQMEMEAPFTEHKNGDKVTYQWMIFFPNMNMVLTCHEFNMQHAWLLGKETITALNTNNTSTVNKRLGKLAFPHKGDNVQSLKLISAVFIEPNTRNTQF
jgi:hypothetical protein